MLPRRGVGGQQRQREADEAVRAHLQQNARQDDRARRGSFGVRVGQPGVEREHRHLDGEREEESPEENTAGSRWKTAAPTASSVGMSKVYGRAGHLMRVIVKRQNRQQHQHRAGQRVQEELDGRVQPPVAAPDADQEVHRDQHHFPEQVEEEEIERHEDAQHARLQQQEENVVFLLADLDGAPGRKDGDGAQQRGQHHQQEADAVDSQRVVRADGGNPVVTFRGTDSPARRSWKRQSSGSETSRPSKPNRLPSTRCSVFAFARGTNSSTIAPTSGVNKNHSSG